MSESSIVEVTLGPQHENHSHCACGAVANGYYKETGEWTCERCGALREHNRLSTWFLENISHEVREGGLVDNVIRLLSERMEMREIAKNS